MDLKEFIENFAAEFDETPIEDFAPDTDYKSLDEWNSLTALSIISMVDEELDKSVTGSELKSVSTIKELFDLIQAK